MKLYRTSYGTKSLMVGVALAALLTWAVKYSRDSEPARLWAGFLKDGDLPARRLAAQELSQLEGSARESAPALIRALLQDEDAEVRGLAAGALGRLFAPAEQIPLPESLTPSLVLALQDREADVRSATAMSLGMIKADPAIATPPLLSLAADDPSPTVRSASLTSLTSIIAEAEAMKPEFRALVARAMTSPDEVIRRQGIYNFVILTDRFPPLATIILRDGDRPTRQAAVFALRTFHPKIHSVISPLLEALRDGDDELLALAATIVCDTIPAPGAPDRMVVGLIAALRESPYPESRRSAARVLAAYGARAQAALPALAAAEQEDPTQTVRNESTTARVAIERALATTSPESPQRPTGD